MPPAALLEEAAAGHLPAWARLSPGRLEHSGRVAQLLGSWAAELGLATGEVARWRAAGYLHDAMRDAPPEVLRPLVSPPLSSMGRRLLHGPAAAALLRADGLDDEELLCAIEFHTVGHPSFGELGRALFVADYVEPGRRHEPLRLAALRARMPHARTEVLREVLHARIQRLLTEGRPIRMETAAFWNAINGGQVPPALHVAT
jgi:HD superfamily phosphohydrolase YqeK